LALALCAGTLFLACSSSPTEQADIASVIVTPSSAQLTALGATAQLGATARDAVGNAISGVTFSWGSSNTNAATVDQSGLVTAVGSGTATITASASGQSDDASVTVNLVVSSVEVSPSAATLTSVGDTQQLTAVAKDANGNTLPGETFDWTSSDTSRAVVSGSGLVTARGNGAATITARVSGGTASGTSTVTVNVTVTSVEVTPVSASLAALDDTRQFTAVAKGLNGNPIPGRAFVWSSDPDTVATVSTAGLATAEGNGSATITAMTGGIEGSATLVVSQVPASVQLSPASPAPLTAIDETAQFTAVANDANGNAIPDQAITWQSTITSVATIDTVGLATATGTGSTTIIALTDGVADSAQLTVSQVVTGIDIDPIPANIEALDDTLHFTAVGTDANGNPVPGQTYGWRSSNTATATITGAGVATAVDNGITWIVASTAGVADSIRLVVSQRVAFIEVTPELMLVDVGTKVQYSALATDANGNVVSDATFVWESSDPSTASISPSGLATAEAEGTTTISAFADGAEGQAILSVREIGPPLPGGGGG
jgi:hypothetical protein